MRSFTIILALGFVAVGSSTALAETFNVFLDGSQVVGVGDPTGSGNGTITLDPFLNRVSWSVDYSNLSNNVSYPVHLSGWHIHGPNGSVGSNAASIAATSRIA